MNFDDYLRFLARDPKFILHWRLPKILGWQRVESREDVPTPKSAAGLKAGADLGGAGGGRSIPSGIRTSADPKGGPPLYYFEMSTFGDIPQNFERVKQKLDFWSKILQKVPKNAFFGVFSEILAETGSLYCFGRAQKINLVGIEKKSSKF